jgi:2'-5' RNA ligase
MRNSGGYVMRLFIALELPDKVVTTLQNMQQQLRRSGQHPVKWVDPANIHLTLRFLGEVSEQQMPVLLAALEAVQVESSHAMLHLQKAGAFPNLKRPQVIWAGVGGGVDALARFQQAISRELEPLGFPPETRPFHAHITLGRVRRDSSTRQQTVLGNAITNLAMPEKVAWPLELPILFQSTLTPRGAIYRKVDYEAL